MKIFIKHDEECPEKSIVLETSLKENGVSPHDITWLYTSDSDKAEVYDKFMVPHFSGDESRSLYLSNDWLCVKPLKPLINYFEELTSHTCFNFEFSLIYYKNDHFPEFLTLVQQKKYNALVSLLNVRGECFIFSPYVAYDTVISTMSLLKYSHRHPYKYKDHPLRGLWLEYFNKVVSFESGASQRDNQQ